MNKRIYSDLKDIKKGYYWNTELLSKELQCGEEEIELLGYNKKSGVSVYKTPIGAVAIAEGGFDSETKIGWIEYRLYQGDLDKLNTKGVEREKQHRKEMEAFYASLDNDE